MASSDLATLAAVKVWAGVTTSESDAILTALTTATSRLIYGYINRSTVLPQTWTERLDGLGYPQNRFYPRNYPIISVSSVTIDNFTIPAAMAPGPGNIAPNGYLLDPWDGTPPGRPQAVDVYWYSPSRRRQGIVVTYVAGYQVTGEAAVVPATPFMVTVAQPFGPWASDVGVTYASGVALTPVASSPTTGQYMLGATPGTYVFSLGDVGASILLNYGFVPQDLEQACIELVLERFRYRARAGEQSKTIGGQVTTRYALNDIPAMTKLILQPYRRITPS
jgi:hypothetical protein